MTEIEISMLADKKNLDLLKRHCAKKPVFSLEGETGQYRSFTEMYDPAKDEKYHTLIFGPTGSGKSYTLINECSRRRSAP